MPHQQAAWGQKGRYKDFSADALGGLSVLRKRKWAGEGEGQRKAKGNRPPEDLYTCTPYTL